jgi:hypothetical protein
MPTVDQERNMQTALEMYGPLKAMHDTPRAVPSFIAHTLMVRAFRLDDIDAGMLVDGMIKEAREAPRWQVTREFTTHRGTRKWEVTARHADPATMFLIQEQKLGRQVHPLVLTVVT